MKIALTNSQHPIDPVPCNNQDKGHCECGDTSKGFYIYTFWIENDQRSPTFNMMKVGEEPVFARFDIVGAGMEISSPRPESSLCII